MKVLSDIYSYSKNKSASIFNSNDVAKSGKKENGKSESMFSSWKPSSWKSSSSSWYNKSWKNSFSSMYPSAFKGSMSWNPTKYLQNVSLPKITIPSCSFHPISFVIEWFKILLSKVQEATKSVKSYVVDIHKSIKHKCCLCNCVSSLKFDSNPKYVAYPWYKRAYFVTRDKFESYVNTKEEKVHDESAEKEADDVTESLLKKSSSKSKVDDKRSSKDSVDEKFCIKHSQSSKYSNDITTLRSSKKLKKTNTDDINTEQNQSMVNSNIESANNELAKEKEAEPKIEESKETITKSDSVYIDAKEEISTEVNDAKEQGDVTASEPTNTDTKEVSTESSKFNIKKTWDKFSKIIS